MKNPEPPTAAELDQLAAAFVEQERDHLRRKRRADRRESIRTAIKTLTGRKGDQR